MSLLTAEGKIKAQVNKLLAKYPDLYKFTPVPYGYGASTLDYIVCLGGSFIAIETKAPGKEPTPRQIETIRRIRQAGGQTFVVDGIESLSKLERYLDTLSQFQSLTK